MNVLADRIQSKTYNNNKLKFIFTTSIIIFGSLLIALSAKISLPLWPVSISMQSFAVLFLAMAFGPRIGVGAVLAYLAQAAMGFPVLSGTMSGLPVLLGPTAGYFLGFIVAAGFAGMMANKGHCVSWIKTFVIALLASFLILIPGALLLMPSMGIEDAFVLGIMPFLFGDLLKTLMLAVVIPLLHQSDK